MGLREQAESDLALTLEDPSVGSPFVLIDPTGTEYTVVGTVGDIGLLIAPESGERIRSRSIVCSCRIKTLEGLGANVPGRGWRARITDLQGNTLGAYVEGNDPDRTLGIYNLVIGMDVEAQDE
ncbi:MAG: hypothetical protein LBC77_01235 [Spirochaetaceae bacterium]|nr:hypothetical protein [Spirochaetaceae bacterium]